MEYALFNCPRMTSELFDRNGANELLLVQASADSLFAVDQQEVLFSLADGETPGATQRDLKPAGCCVYLGRSGKPRGLR